jgi:hypothetical protein
MTDHATTRTHLAPPRLGLAILNRLADRNEALAGDLLEGFRLKQSRLWFWRELIGAILTGGFRRAEIRPIRLVDFPSWQPPREDFARKRRNLQVLGLSASPVEGIGGISIVVVIMLISLVEPALWVMLALGMVTGIAIGIGRAMYRSRHMPAPGADLTTLVLFNRQAR